MPQQHTTALNCAKHYKVKGQKRKQSGKTQERTNMILRFGGESIEKVDSFLYLGRWLTGDDSDEVATINNIRKVQTKWKKVSPVLTREGAQPKIMTSSCTLKPTIWQ